MRNISNLSPLGSVIGFIFRVPRNFKIWGFVSFSFFIFAGWTFFLLHPLSIQFDQLNSCLKINKKQSIVAVKSLYDLKLIEKENFLIRKDLVLGQNLSQDRIKDFFCKTADVLEIKSVDVKFVSEKRLVGLNSKKYDIFLEASFRKIIGFFDLISCMGGFVKIDSFDIFRENESFAKARLRVKLIKGD
jgi:hypothetical protein